MSLHNHYKTLGTYVDLHGFFVYEAYIVVDRMIDTTSDLLQNNKLEPNFDENNHLLNIICGGGNSKKNGGVLKRAIRDMIERKGYDHKYLENLGVILVRFSK